jgi:hypothetical protein
MSKAGNTALNWQDWIWKRREHDPLVRLGGFSGAADPRYSTALLMTRKGLILEATAHDLNMLIDACTDDAFSTSGPKQNFSIAATQNLLQASAAKRALANHIAATSLSRDLSNEGETLTPAQALSGILALQRVAEVPPPPVRQAKAELDGFWQAAEAVAKHRRLRLKRARPNDGPAGDYVNG